METEKKDERGGNRGRSAPEPQTVVVFTIKKRKTDAELEKQRSGKNEWKKKLGGKGSLYKYTTQQVFVCLFLVPASQRRQERTNIEKTKTLGKLKKKKSVSHRRAE